MSDISQHQIANGDAPPGTSHKSHTNRANAQNSTGPRTDAGKQRSSLNALRHGLTGQTVLLPSDDPAAYQLHCQEFHDHYRPKNKMEVQLTQTIADLTWRLNRITAIEANLVTADVSAAGMSQAFRQQSQAMANLSMYERRLSVRFKETLKQLREIQAERVAQEAVEMFDAANILQMHRKKDIPYNPIEDGFVFSAPDIETYIRRRDRKRQAYMMAS
jgi:hypothetical protein